MDNLLKNVGLLNFHYEKTNFGANFVAFALQEVVKKLGFNPQIINFNPERQQDKENKFISEKFYDFKNKFLYMTEEYTSRFQLSQLNERFNQFITGSDQVWNAAITRENTGIYYLDFVNTEKNKISYAASMGRYSPTINETLNQSIKNNLNRLDFISVRESSALKVIQENYNIEKEIVEVLDPTLLLDAEDYNPILNSEKHRDLPANKYLAFYFLADRTAPVKNYEKQDFFNFEKRIGLESVNCYGYKTKYENKAVFKYNSMADWLNIIKNSSLVVTDSFHGICFSIIYKKNFIYKNTATTVNSRILDLLSKLGIKERIFENYDDVTIDFALNPIDYDFVYKKLNEEKEKSINFLQNALNSALDKDFIIKKMSLALEERDNELKKYKKNNIPIKEIIWKKWLDIFYKLPEPIKIIIRFFRKTKVY